MNEIEMSGTDGPVSNEAELEILVASQWKLVWKKFRRHKLARLSLLVIAILYTTVVFAEFVAPRLPHRQNRSFAHAPPQRVRFFYDGQIKLHVRGYSFERDPLSLQRIYTVHEDDIIPVGFFVRGEPYRMWGLFTAERRLFGAKSAGDPFFLMGADATGRDVFSRLIYSARVSLTVGLVGVALTFVLGILIGGVSGLVGGKLDNFIQRVIEIVLSIPQLPFWLALAAMVPIHWSPLQTYMMITVILAFLSWTGIARVVRSKFLSLREHDFVLAAELDGCSKTRIIIRYMLPSFYSHIIASITLTVPAVIIGETALSFLGLGLRPPVVSWGVMLQDAQRVAAMADHPWLLWPAAAVFVTVVAFNYLGDGLRDAADPYSQ